MSIGDLIKKITDIIMPMDTVEEEEQPKKAEPKVEEKVEAPKVEHKAEPQAQQPLEQSTVNSQAQSFKQAAGLGGNGFTRTRVTTSDSATVGDKQYRAYTSSEPSVRPSLAILKTPQITMKIYSPAKYDEQVKLIGQDLIKNSAVVVNYEGTDDAIQQRIGDFLLGVIYTINGHVEMISSKIVLYVPEDFEVESAQAAMSARLRRYN